MLRDRLMKENEDVILSVLGLYPEANRQQLRSLVRAAQKEQATHTTT